MNTNVNNFTSHTSTPNNLHTSVHDSVRNYKVIPFIQTVSIEMKLF